MNEQIKDDTEDKLEEPSEVQPEVLPDNQLEEPPEDPRKVFGRSCIKAFLNNDQNFRLYKGFAIKRCNAELLKGRHYDIIAMAVERMARMLDNALKEEKDTDKDFRKSLRNSIDERNEVEFNRLLKLAFYRAIEWSAVDILRDEWDDFYLTDSFDEFEEWLGELEFAIPSGNLSHDDMRRIDPSRPFNESSQQSEEKAKRWALGEEVTNRWLSFLEKKRDEAPSDASKQAMAGVIAWERLALSDEHPVRHYEREKRGSGETSYHWLIGGTWGKQPEILQNCGATLRTFQDYLKKMRTQYWPEFEAAIRKEIADRKEES